jgi:hypothetical protein
MPAYFEPRLRLFQPLYKKRKRMATGHPRGMKQSELFGGNRAGAKPGTFFGLF